MRRSKFGVACQANRLPSNLLAMQIVDHLDAARRGEREVGHPPRLVRRGLIGRRGMSDGPRTLPLMLSVDRFGTIPALNFRVWRKTISDSRRL